MPAFRNLAAICDPWSATNICILIKRDFLARLICIWFCDPWSVISDFLRKFFKFFSQNLPAFRILAAICDPWSATNICIVLFWLRERFSGLADMLIILWSVIRDQWFSKIEFSKFFLKICQPLEFLPRSVIRDPLLIFVLYYSD